MPRSSPSSRARHHHPPHLSLFLPSPAFFLPCLQHDIHSTIHITPEDGFSYASFELCGYDPGLVDTATLVEQAAAIFQPRNMAVALSLDSVAPGATAPGWGGAFVGPAGYDCHSASYQELKCGGYVAFFTLEQQPGAMEVVMAAVAEAAAAAPTKAGSSNSGSPRGVLKHFPSSANLARLASGSAGGAEAAAAATTTVGGSSSGASSSPASVGGDCPADCPTDCHPLAASMMSIQTDLDVLALREESALGGSEDGMGTHAGDASSEGTSSLASSLLLVDHADLRFEDVLTHHGAAYLPSVSAGSHRLGAAA